jgi:hypothetical protein
VLLLIKSVNIRYVYEGVSESFRTDRLERELQAVQVSAAKCSCIAILWVSLVSFATITPCVLRWTDPPTKESYQMSVDREVH